MNTPHSKRIEYWNHFIEQWIVAGHGGGHGVTGPKLRKIKRVILADDAIWDDVIWRHNGLARSPEKMQAAEPHVYEHCAGNFWGMVMQELVKQRLVK